jgi:hypothetical protein
MPGAPSCPGAVLSSPSASRRRNWAFPLLPLERLEPLAAGPRPLASSWIAAALVLPAQSSASACRARVINSSRLRSRASHDTGDASLLRKRGGRRRDYSAGGLFLAEYLSPPVWRRDCGDWTGCYRPVKSTVPDPRRDRTAPGPGHYVRGPRRRSFGFDAVPWHRIGRAASGPSPRLTAQRPLFWVPLRRLVVQPYESIRSRPNGQEYINKCPDVGLPIAQPYRSV